MSGGPTKSHRPWWKLHLLTWVLLCCVAGSVVVKNVVSCTFYMEAIESGWDYGSMPEAWTLPIFGWPFVYAEPNESLTEGEIYFQTWIADKEQYLWSFSGAMDYSLPDIFTNVIIALVILLITAFTTESYLRRQAKWHQFSIQFILALTTFVALLLTIAKYDLDRGRRYAAWEYIPFFFICLGLWCVFWTGWRLIGWGVGRLGGGSEDG